MVVGVYMGVYRGMWFYMWWVYRGEWVYIWGYTEGCGCISTGVYRQGYVLDTLLCTTPVWALYPLEVFHEPCHLSLQGLSYP